VVSHFIIKVIRNDKKNLPGLATFNVDSSTVKGSSGWLSGSFSFAKISSIGVRASEDELEDEGFLFGLCRDEFFFNGATVLTFFVGDESLSGLVNLAGFFRFLVLGSSSLPVFNSDSTLSAWRFSNSFADFQSARRKNNSIFKNGHEVNITETHHKFLSSCKDTSPTFLHQAHDDHG